MPDRCSWHRPSGLSYIASSDDADRRMARGEKQSQCSDCRRWYWPHEWGERPDG